MIIIRLMGGLGNQLQQYALYEKLKSMGREVFIDDSWFADPEIQKNALAPRKLEIAFFPGAVYERASSAQIRKLLGSGSVPERILKKIIPSFNKRLEETCMYHPEVFEKENLYLEGYWAADRYCFDLRSVLQKKLAFPAPNEENQKMAEQMQSGYSVSVHIRRGDYLDPANAQMFGGICTDAYYESAIALVKEAHPEAKFYLFSDDPTYCREHFVGDCYQIVDLNTGEMSVWDIWLMSKCRTNICANSTFSFWGARLNQWEDAIRIRPSIHKNSQVFVKDEMHKLWPDWILIDPAGEIR